MSGTVLPEPVASELSRMNESRRNVYEALARCFEKEMDIPFAEALANGLGFASDDEALTEEVRALQECLRDADDTLMERMAVLFSRLFFGIGPAGARRAFPYESVYTSSKGLLMQDAFETTRVAYREHGLERNEAFGEPDDHLAVQLAFMAHLCSEADGAIAARDGKALEQAYAEQAAFLDGHLLDWVPVFARELEMAGTAAAGEREGDDAPEMFYVHLARTTLLFLRFDRECLADLLTEEG